MRKNKYQIGFEHYFEKNKVLSPKHAFQRIFNEFDFKNIKNVKSVYKNIKNGYIINTLHSVRYKKYKNKEYICYTSSYKTGTGITYQIYEYSDYYNVKEVKNMYDLFFYSNYMIETIERKIFKRLDMGI